jgi:hypothetical protein
MKQVSIPGRIKGFFSSSQLPDELWSTLTLLTNAGIKRPGHEADHSLSSAAEARNMWSYTATSPCIFMP